MQLISKHNREIWFLLYVIYILSKHAWVILFKGKKSIASTNAFQTILDKLND